MIIHVSDGCARCGCSGCPECVNHWTEPCKCRSQARALLNESIAEIHERMRVYKEDDPRYNTKAED